MNTKEDKKETEENNKKQETKNTEGEAKEKERAQLLDEPIKIKDIVYMTILSLESKAWAYLDLVVHPETQKHQKDPEQAKAAIDAIEALYKTIEAGLDPAEKKDIQVRLTNLRLNFAKQ